MLNLTGTHTARCTIPIGKDEFRVDIAHTATFTLHELDALVVSREAEHQIADDLLETYGAAFTVRCDGPPVQVLPIPTVLRCAIDTAGFHDPSVELMVTGSARLFPRRLKYHGSREARLLGRGAVDKTEGGLTIDGAAAERYVHEIAGGFAHAELIRRGLLGGARCPARIALAPYSKHAVCTVRAGDRVLRYDFRFDKGHGLVVTGEQVALISVLREVAQRYYKHLWNTPGPPETNQVECGTHEVLLVEPGQNIPCWAWSGKDNDAYFDVPYQRCDRKRNVRLRADWPMTETGANLDVLIAGGGPAGLVAARVVAEASPQRDRVRTGSGDRNADAHEQRTLDRRDAPVRDSGRSLSSGLAPSAGIAGRQRGLRFCRTGRLHHRCSRRLPASRARSAARRRAERDPNRRDQNRSSKTGACRIRSDGVERDVTAKIVVDASGYRADISRAAGLHPGFTRFGVGAEYEVIAPQCRQDEVVLIVGNRYAPARYAWVFSWGRGRVRIGVGLLHSDKSEDARKLIHDVHERSPPVRRRSPRLHDHGTHFGLIPAAGLAELLVGDGIVAVGDAAGVATLVVG